MKRNFDKGFKRFGREFLGVTFLMLIIGIAFLSDMSIVRIPSVFILRIENQEDLFFTLFSVQATIASVGVAIIALLSGAVTQSAYGICFSRFIADIKPAFLKHKFLLITNLAIVVVNYFVVSYEFFNVSIALFFSSIVISIILIRDTYVIFLGQTAVKAQIRQYILENYDENTLKDIYTSLNILDSSNNLLCIREDFELIEDVFEKELSIHNTEQSPESCKKIEQLSTALIADMLKKSEPQLTMLVLNHILNLYKLGNDRENKFPLSIWNDIIHEYFDSLKNLTHHQINDSGLFWEFHKQLCYNQPILYDTKGRLRNNSLKYYSTWLYNSLKKSEYANSSEIERMPERLHRNIVMMYEYDKTLSADQRDVLMSELCVFAKNLIDCGDYQNMSKLYFDINFYHDEEHEHTSLFTALIYLYYLACREPLAENDGKKVYAEQIIKDNIGTIENFLHNVDVVKLTNQRLGFIRKLLDTWEIMLEGVAKTMIIDNVINDFFIFVVLNQFYSKENLMKVVCNISPDSSFSIYSSYFSGDGKNLKTLFSQFQSVFCNNSDDSHIDEKIDLLRNVLYEKYKNEELQEGIKEKITEEDTDRFSKLIHSEVENIINENSTLLNSTMPTEGVKKENICILTITLHNLTIKHDSLDSFISKAIFNNIINLYLLKLKNHIVTEHISSSSRDIQEKFIQLIKANNINGDTYLGNRDIFWSEENQGLLKDFVASMNKVNFPQGYSQLYVIDTSSVYFKCSNIKVDFEDLSEAEIKERCKWDENDRLMYNVTNDIYIPFDEQELREHIHHISKKAKVSLDISYKIDSTAGVGMIIEKEIK